MNNEYREFEHSFKQYRQQPQPLTVGDDFESRVFAKIKKKKTQRKVAASAALGIALFAFLFIAQTVLIHKEPEPVLAVQPRIVQPEMEAKEEVPLVEDVIYASSDSRSNYAIEQVAYSGDQDTI